MTVVYVSVVWAAMSGLLYALMRRDHQTDNDRLVAMIATDRAHHRDSLERLMVLHEQTTERLCRPHPDLTELVALVDRLCQRIQAPEQAVVEHAMQMPLPPMPQVIEMDDDDRHFETKEQMAEREMDEEAQAMRSMLA